MTAIDDAPHLELLSAFEPPCRVIDRADAERAAADLLSALGANLDHEQLRETPRRMIDAYVELHRLVRDDPRTRHEFLGLTTRSGT